jgi:hypothetical protein
MQLSPSSSICGHHWWLQQLSIQTRHNSLTVAAVMCTKGNPTCAAVQQSSGFFSKSPVRTVYWQYSHSCTQAQTEASMLLSLWQRLRVQTTGGRSNRHQQQQRCSNSNIDNIQLPMCPAATLRSAAPIHQCRAKLGKLHPTAPRTSGPFQAPLAARETTAVRQPINQPPRHQHPQQASHACMVWRQQHSQACSDLVCPGKAVLGHTPAVDNLHWCESSAPT